MPQNDFPPRNLRYSYIIKNMPRITAPRRSKRLTAKSKAKSSPYSSGRRASSSIVSSVDLEALEAIISKNPSKASKKRALSKGAIEALISSHSSTKTEPDTDEENDETETQTHDSAEDFDKQVIKHIRNKRNGSYDSRYESGNEDYELDDFVVDDDAEISSDSDCDTIVPTNEYIQDTIRSASILSSALSIVSEATRRSSSSTTSKLFFSDPEDAAKRHDMLAWLELGITSNDPEDIGDAVVTEADAEIIEEIWDAVALFSRRCNRERAPVRLRLASIVGRDEEVKEALDRAVELGFGRKLSLKDGTKLWSIGPRKR